MKEKNKITRINKTKSTARHIKFNQTQTKTNNVS